MPGKITVAALAEAAGVDRRRIYKWRRDGAPDGVDAIAWYEWLRSRGGRAKMAAAHRIQSAFAGTPGVDDSESPPPSPPPDEHVDDLFEIRRLPLPDQESSWRAIERREKALAAQLAREQREGRLVAADEARAAMGDILGAVLRHMQEQVWARMQPCLVDMPADRQRALRAAHDAGIIDIRSAASAAIRRKMATLTQEDSP